MGRAVVRRRWESNGRLDGVDDVKQPWTAGAEKWRRRGLPFMASACRQVLPAEIIRILLMALAAFEAFAAFVACHSGPGPGQARPGQPLAIQHELKSSQEPARHGTCSTTYLLLGDFQFVFHSLDALHAAGQLDYIGRSFGARHSAIEHDHAVDALDVQFQGRCLLICL